MDIQIMDQNGKSGVTMQHEELHELLECAEKWTEISNDHFKCVRVKQLVKVIRAKVNTWMREYSKKEQ